jgi:hypothetical protein
MKEKEAQFSEKEMKVENNKRSRNIKEEDRD